MTVNSELDFELIGRDLFQTALKFHEQAPSQKRKTRIEKESVVLEIVHHALDLAALRDDADRLTNEQHQAISRGMSLALEEWVREPENPLDTDVTA